MTLDRLRPAVKGAIEPSVGLAQRLGLTPNGVSVLAFGFAFAAAVAFTVAPRESMPLLFFAGAVCVALNGWLDVVDGELARQTGTGDAAGDLLDHVLDRYADILIIAGLAAGIEAYAIGFAAVTGVFMTSYLGTQAQAVGLDRVYGGLVGRADRLALVILVATVAAFVPQSVSGLTIVGWLLVFFAVVGHITALQRFYYAYRAL